MNDLDIARAAKPQHIDEIARKVGIDPDHLEHYGRYKAKVNIKTPSSPKGKLILVTAMTPTPAGEGKTTVSIGLCDAMNEIGAKAMLALREPSLGPVFGMKGGATGGGYSQVIPMEDINLHFTGDFHAIEKANNLLAALIDNNIQSKERSLGIDPRTVIWKRVMDMNDRSLREMVTGLGGTGNGVPREAGFNITAASEIMAIICLANDIDDLKQRFARIIVGFTYDRKAVYASDLNAQGAMAALLKDAIKPNLVQTLAGNAALIHGGPFANIAQGTNSVIATKTAMSLADYTVTEAGFGSDLGAEKFLDIKCRMAGISPSAMVIVATVRALKYHGGVPVSQLNQPNVDALKKGMDNLARHIENSKVYGVPAVIAINRFTADTDEEVNAVIAACDKMGVQAFNVNYWAHGGKGGTNLAEAVRTIADSNNAPFTPVYANEQSITEKIETVAKRIYGAASVDYSVEAKAVLARIEKLGLSHLPVCIAKTQYSFSDNAKLLGRARDFVLTIRDIEIAAGAGFVVPIAGTVMRMPGLPAIPSAENIDIDADGNISGLF
jgi:formate--tetrahydrofolate ligase